MCVQPPDSSADLLLFSDWPFGAATALSSPGRRRVVCYFESQHKNGRCNNFGAIVRGVDDWE